MGNLYTLLHRLTRLPRRDPGIPLRAAVRTSLALSFPSAEKCWPGTVDPDELPWLVLGQTGINAAIQRPRQFAAGQLGHNPDRANASPFVITKVVSRLLFCGSVFECCHILRWDHHQNMATSSGTHRLGRACLGTGDPESGGRHLCRLAYGMELGREGQSVASIAISAIYPAKPRSSHHGMDASALTGDLGLRSELEQHPSHFLL